MTSKFFLYKTCFFSSFSLLLPRPLPKPLFLLICSFNFPFHVHSLLTPPTMPPGHLLEEALRKPTPKKPKRRKKKPQPPVVPPKPTTSPPQIDAEGFTLVTASLKSQPKVLLPGINTPPALIAPASPDGRQEAAKTTRDSQVQESEEERRDAVEMAWRRDSRWETRASPPPPPPPCSLPERDAPRKIIVRLPPTMGSHAPASREDNRIKRAEEDESFNPVACKGTQFSCQK